MAQRAAKFRPCWTKGKSLQLTHRKRDTMQKLHRSRWQKIIWWVVKAIQILTSPEEPRTCWCTKENCHLSPKAPGTRNPTQAAPRAVLKQTSLQPPLCRANRFQREATCRCREIESRSCRSWLLRWGITSSRLPICMIISIKTWQIWLMTRSKQTWRDMRKICLSKILSETLICWLATITWPWTNSGQVAWPLLTAPSIKTWPELATDKIQRNQARIQ